MRRAAAVLVGFAIALGAVATASAATPQQQINVLKAKVTKLQNQMRSVLAEQACYDTLHPIAQFGDPAGTFGYLWGENSTVVATTGLDYVDPNTAVADRDFFWFVSYNAECAQAALQRSVHGKRVSTARPATAKPMPRNVGQFRWHW
jgi:hypothetical protein